ncbi:MAG: hypothetical protein HYZ00_02460, partial [Candidatus Hydrogenedentes bacterium]|nr:hypothetical protein [Candidatus Hydrogenedentota bacterium]
ELALEALEEKRNFVETLLDAEGAGPLGLLALTRDGRPYVDLEQAVFLVAVEGLNECVQVLLNTEAHRSAEALRLAQRTLGHLQAQCAARGETRGLRVALAQNNDAAVSNRFATLDLKAFPRTARTAVKPHPVTQALQYTTGARLNWSPDLNPAEGIRMEGSLHEYLEEGALACVPLPGDNTAPASVADFLRKVFHNSAVRQIMFE